MSALALAAVGRTGRKTGLVAMLESRRRIFLFSFRRFGSTYVALAADVLVAVELGGQSLQRGLDDTTTQTEDQVQGGLL